MLTTTTCFLRDFLQIQPRDHVRPSSECRSVGSISHPLSSAVSLRSECRLKATAHWMRSLLSPKVRASPGGGTNICLNKSFASASKSRARKAAARRSGCIAVRKHKKQIRGKEHTWHSNLDQSSGAPCCTEEKLNLWAADP